MKIAMILPSLSGTGPGIVVKDLCTELVARGHCCRVFCFDSGDGIEMPCPTQRIGYFEQIGFSKWDVVHAHMLRSDGYVWLHRLLSFRRPGCRFVSTLHNPVTFKALVGYGKVRAALGSACWRLFLHASDRVVVLNPHTKASVEWIGSAKLALILNGRNIPVVWTVGDPSDRAAIGRLREKYTVVGTVSGIVKRKGLEQMVRALTRLPGYAFVAVGDGPELGNLQRLASELGVADRCYWTGYRSDATDYQSMFDLFVMCSRSEGFPLALIEAAAYGKPMVLSDIPMLRSAVSGDQAVFYELDRIDSLARALERAHRDAAFYSESIRSYYLAHLTREIMADNYLRLYRGE